MPPAIGPSSMSMKLPSEVVVSSDIEVDSVGCLMPSCLGKTCSVAAVIVVWAVVVDNEATSFRSGCCVVVAVVSFDSGTETTPLSCALEEGTGSSFHVPKG